VLHGQTVDQGIMVLGFAGFCMTRVMVVAFGGLWVLSGSSYSAGCGCGLGVYGLGKSSRLCYLVVDGGLLGTDSSL
jgi:hypothetical protein